MSRIVLEGCRTEPLASYLKALAVFRIVSEQADNSAQGFWENGTFVLETEFGEEELLDFLLNRYSPTPIVSPWNGGSGFWPNDSREGMDRILASADERFESYRKVIREIRQWPELDVGLSSIAAFMRELRALRTEGAPEESRKAEKGLKSIDQILSDNPRVEPAALQVMDILTGELEEESPYPTALKALRKEVKKGVTTLSAHKRTALKKNLGICRARLPEESLRWFDAAIAITSDGSLSYFRLLGTGGNDGNLDFSRNFMNIASDLLLNPGREKEQLLEASLMGIPVCGLDYWSIGQFDPGRAGGYNMGDEVETKDFKINPWDFLMVLEGTVLMAASVTRRNTIELGRRASLPFTVNFSPVGFTSDSEADQGDSETWLPTWPNPATLSEIKYLFAEGRSSLGRRIARNGIDFCRAVGQLGVDRGLSSFTRYAFVVRRGKSYVALPAGTVNVGYRPELSVLDELDPIMIGIDRFLNGYGDNKPAALAIARRAIEEELYETSRASDPKAFARLVRALGRLEMRLSRMDHSSKNFPARPFSGLSTDWVRQCLPSCPEAPLAAALASIKSENGVGPIRSNTSGVHPRRPWEWDDSQQSWVGSGLPERMVSTLSRRLLERSRHDASSIPLRAMVRVSTMQVSPFIYGLVDDKALEELLFGFTLVNWDQSVRIERPVEDTRMPLSRSWALLKLMMSPEINQCPIGKENTILKLAAAGRTCEACNLASARLRHVAELPVLPVDYECDSDPVRLAAALLFPVWDIHRLKKLVLSDKEVQE